MNWSPGRMEEERALQAPRPGVPEDLAQRLKEWFLAEFTSRPENFFEVIIWLQQTWPDPRRRNVPQVFNLFRAWAEGDQTRYLDVVHHLLVVRGADGVGSNLRAIFDGSNSLYQIRDDGRGLDERQPAAMVDNVKQVVADSQTSVSKHLTSAYNAAYGYDKNTAFAYAEAIRAVEVAMRDVVGQDSIFRAITNAAKDTSNWELVLTDHRPEKYKGNAPAADGVETVLDLMRLLAYGEHHRHGDDGTGTDPSDVEAKAAVQLAITLVQLAQSGAFGKATT